MSDYARTLRLLKWINDNSVIVEGPFTDEMREWLETEVGGERTHPEWEVNFDGQLDFEEDFEEGEWAVTVTGGQEGTLGYLESHSFWFWSKEKAALFKLTWG